MAGECELRTSIAMLASGAIGAGGSFTEIQAPKAATASSRWATTVPPPRDQRPAAAAAWARPPQQAGWGVSVELDVTHGPVTSFGVGQDPHGS
jgi:L-arabinose isomerase